MSSRKSLALALAFGLLLGGTFFPPQALSALISRIYTFTDGSVLTASQLNTEFNNVVDGVNSISDANISSGAAIDPLKLSSTIAGDGIQRSGVTGVLSVGVDGSTIETAGDALRVKDSGITASKVAAAVAGSGLSGGAGTNLAVNVDDSTIEINSDTLRVKDSGITSAKILDGTIAAGDIASNAVTTAKISDSNVTTAKIADSNVTTAKIADSNVTTAKIANSNVTAAKVESNINLPGTNVKADGRNVVVTGASGTFPLAIVRGTVNAAGTITHGDGFTAVRNSTGTYTITFDNTFANNVAAVASGQATNINAVTSSLGSSSFVVQTANINSSSALTDAGFSFIAIAFR